MNIELPNNCLLSALLHKLLVDSCINRQLYIYIQLSIKTKTPMNIEVSGIHAFSYPTKPQKTMIKL